MAAGLTVPLPADAGGGPLRFRVALAPGSAALAAPGHSEIAVEVSPDGDRVAATGAFLLSHRHVRALATTQYVGYLSAPLRRAHDAAVGALIAAAQRVVDLLAQELQARRSHGQLRAWTADQWSRDGRTWADAPARGVPVLLQATSLLRLDAAFAAGIQRHLDAGEQPLAALYFLHGAFAQPEPAGRWIYAATAAELAVKEVLLRHDPAANADLLTQAVPTRLLFGRRLAAFTGPGWTYRKDLQRGARVRNDLIHRPEEALPEPLAAAEYLGRVEGAVRDLVRRLRGEVAGTAASGFALTEIVPSGRRGGGSGPAGGAGPAGA